MQLEISGIAGYDGTYDLDLVRPFTMREFHTIKDLAGIRGGELPDAIAAGDTDLMVAFAVIAIQRSGRQIHPDLIWDAPAASIVVQADPEPEDPTPPTPIESAPGVGTDEAKPPSGETSSEPTETSPESNPNPTGDPGSDTTAP